MQVALIQAPTSYADGNGNWQQIAAGAKPITKAHGSSADIEMATIAQDAITGFQQSQAATLETTGENDKSSPLPLLTVSSVTSSPPKPYCNS